MTDNNIVFIFSVFAFKTKASGCFLLLFFYKVAYNNANNAEIIRICTVIASNITFLVVVLLLKFKNK